MSTKASQKQNRKLTYKTGGSDLYITSEEDVFLKKKKKHTHKNEMIVNDLYPYSSLHRAVLLCNID